MHVFFLKRKITREKLKTNADHTPLLFAVPFSDMSFVRRVLLN